MTLTCCYGIISRNEKLAVCFINRSIFWRWFFIVRVNNQIRASQVLLIDDDGNKLGIMPIDEALSHAEEKELDLVEVAPNANPPVCKVMNYGKYRYEQSKREKNAKKRQKAIKIKEIRIRPKIAEHDFQFTKKHIEKFMQEGSKVKVVVTFWGREISHVDIGQEKLERLISELNEICEVEQQPKMEGRNLVMILSPK